MEHTGSGQPAQAVAVASVLGEHKAAQILQRPVADTECTVALQVVVGAAAAAETSPVEHVAAAAAVADAADAAVVVVAIENSVSLHSHSSHIRPTVQVEDVAVKARVPALAQTATEDYMLVVLEVGQPRQQ